MFSRLGPVVFFPSGSGEADAAARSLLEGRQVKFAEATPQLRTRYPKLEEPAVLIVGNLYEGLLEIGKALIYHLRF